MHTMRLIIWLFPVLMLAVGHSAKAQQVVSDSETARGEELKNSNTASSPLAATPSAPGAGTGVAQSTGIAGSAQEQQLNSSKTTESPNSNEQGPSVEQIHGELNRELEQSQDRRATIEAALLKYSAELERFNNPYSGLLYQAAHNQFSDWLFQVDNEHVIISTTTGSKVADTMVRVFEKRATFDSLPDGLPTDVIPRFGRSRVAKNYLRNLLSGRPSQEKDDALTSLCWTQSLKGDPDMYSMLSDLYKHEGESNQVIMAAMTRVDRKKALPILLKEIDSTRDIKKLVGDGGLISEYDDAELLDHVFKRINDFPAAPWYHQNNPVLQIKPELILKYVATAEDDRLDRGLSALELSPAMRDAPPVLFRKFDKGSPKTRLRVARFLKRSAHMKVFREGTAPVELKKRLDAEPDTQVKQVLKGTVDTIEAAQKGIRNHE